MVYQENKQEEASNPTAQNFIPLESVVQPYAQNEKKKVNSTLI